MISIETIYQLYQKNPLVTTDSRKVPPGAIFFALKGPNFNGNTFAADALKNGASLAIIDEAEYARENSTLLVEDALSTLQELALHHRRQFDIPLLAIAGSNGKTTTKELIAAVLGKRYRTHSTPGNLNNYIGLPLTLLQMPENTEVAVIELGANRRGEIKQLCSLCEPTHGMVTNLGKDHLEGFGGIEGVKQANKELFDYLAGHKGVALVNTDEAGVLELASGLKRIIRYQRSETLDPNYAPMETRLLYAAPFLSVSFLDEQAKETTINSQLYGKYNLSNIMSAIAIGRYFKVPGALIKEAIESYRPASNRSQLIPQNGNLIILDAYNANPSSMKVALESLASLPGYEEKVAILGEMKELGEYSRAEHRQVMNLLRTLGIRRAFLLGKAFRDVAPGTPHISCFDTLAELREFFRQASFERAAILIKGSRANKLEEILQEEKS